MSENHTNTKQGLSCAVVQDLLPLYVEGLTQEETNAAVQAHISQCTDCSRALGMQQAQMNTEKAKSENDQRVVRFLKNIVYKRVLTITLIVIASLALLFGIASFLNRTEMVPIEDISIAGKYRLPDGRIMLAVRAKGLNQRNVYYLNSLYCDTTRLFSLSINEAEGIDLRKSLSVAPSDLYHSLSLQGHISLRRSLWYSWFFPADQRGDILYLLIDPSDWDKTLIDYAEQYIMQGEGMDLNSLLMESVYINGTMIWSNSEELRQVSEEEAALLLQAYEAQQPQIPEELPVEEGPDALDILKNSSSD